MKYDAQDPESYFAALPSDRRETLQKVRKLLFETIPNVREAWKYNMPHYEIGELWFALASQKNHLSMYHCYSDLLQEFGPQLGKVSLGKGCVRFKKYEDLDPEGLQALFREALNRSS